MSNNTDPIAAACETSQSVSISVKKPSTRYIDECLGKRKDPKKKTKVCPVCAGVGFIRVCRKCMKPVTQGGSDASGKFRISEDALCGCYPKGALF